MNLCSRSRFMSLSFLAVLSRGSWSSSVALVVLCFSRVRVKDSWTDSDESKQHLFNRVLAFNLSALHTLHNLMTHSQWNHETDFFSFLTVYENMPE